MANPEGRACVRPPTFTAAEGVVATRCEQCQGFGGSYSCKVAVDPCRRCGGRGYFGIDPTAPTIAPPGTAERVAVYMARYMTGMSIWNKQDGDHESDHGEYRWTPLRANGTSAVPRRVVREEIDDDDDID